MIAVKGFKKVELSSLATLIESSMQSCNKTEMEVAVEVNVSSHQTIKNTKSKDKQLVSDQVLTAVMKSVGLNGFIVWANGERLYFISNKK